MILPKTTLKLMTYNIHNGKNSKGEDTFYQIIEFIKTYLPDIIAIQEINENKKRGFQISQIHQYLSRNIHFGPHVNIEKGKYGIATISTYPIIKKHHILLPSIKEQRGLLHTTIQVHHQRFHIFNTHLGLNALERKMQIHTIKKYINTIEEKCTLMGDFNTSEVFFSSENLIDTSKIKGDKNSPTLIGTNKKIDYIFVSSKNIDIISHKVIPIYYSDHFPVTAYINI